MKTEQSAGGVVIRQKGKSWQVLLITDMKGNWTFPKGLINKTETPEEAAKREVFEEVGVEDLKTIKPLTPIHYLYRRGDLISKTVHYFLFFSKGLEKLRPQKEEGVSRARWVSLERSIEIIGYQKTNRGILEEVSLHGLIEKPSVST